MTEFQELCILAPRTPNDGLRVSTMSRHTLNDGQTPDERLAGQYDLWLPELSPGDKLVGQWYRREIDWDSFKAAYVERLSKLGSRTRCEAHASINFLKTYKKVSLMCIEEDPTHCHRSVLLEYLNSL